MKTNPVLEIGKIPGTVVLLVTYHHLANLMLHVMTFTVMQCSTAIFAQIYCSYIKWLAIWPRELEERAAGIISLSGHWGNVGLNVFADWRRNKYHCLSKIKALLASKSLNISSDKHSLSLRQLITLLTYYRQSRVLNIR